MSDPLDYTIGWITALKVEYVAAQVFLDEKHPVPEFISRSDPNTYTLGRIGNHNVVIVVLPQEQYGIVSAASVAADMHCSFPNVRIGLMVGIGGGVPSQKQDIRLGDVVVGTPGHGHGGVIQYNLSTALDDAELKSVGHLNAPPQALLRAMSGQRAEHDIQGHRLGDSINEVLAKFPKLQKDNQRPESRLDRFYRSDFKHTGDKTTPCTQCCDTDPSQMIARPDREGPSVHYGIIASDNILCKNTHVRDKLAANGVLCIEMEAAGLVNHFPCLVIRGIADYADTHKNDQWHEYAASAAAAYAKDLLRHVPSKMRNEKRPNNDDGGLYRQHPGVTIGGAILDRNPYLRAGVGLVVGGLALFGSYCTIMLWCCRHFK